VIQDGLGVPKPDGEHDHDEPDVQPDVPCLDDPYLYAELSETEEFQAAVEQPPNMINKLATIPIVKLSHFINALSGNYARRMEPVVGLYGTG
jgi:hypothetical protein